MTTPFLPFALATAAVRAQENECAAALTAADRELREEITRDLLENQVLAEVERQRLTDRDFSSRRGRGELARRRGGHALPAAVQPEPLLRVGAHLALQRGGDARGGGGERPASTAQLVGRDLRAELEAVAAVGLDAAVGAGAAAVVGISRPSTSVAPSSCSVFSISVPLMV